MLTKNEAAITEHTWVCRSELGPLIVLRLFAWCLGATPDRGRGGVSDSFAFSPYCVTSSSLCVRICAYCCILLSVFSWYLWEPAFFFSGGDQGWGWGDSGELDQGEKRGGDLGGEEGRKTAIWIYCMKEE